MDLRTEIVNSDMRTSTSGDVILNVGALHGWHMRWSILQHNSPMVQLEVATYGLWPVQQVIQT